MTPKEKIIELREMLQKAVELEFATIPPYLTAAFSIHPKANRSSFEIIHSVYMEEMLHMVLAANVLNAIGGTIKLGKENIPKYPLNLEFKGEKFKDRDFNINLERFSLDSIGIFMKIELPDNWDTKYFVEAAKQQGVILAAGSAFGVNYVPNAVRISLVSISHSKLEYSLRIIASLLRTHIT